MIKGEKSLKDILLVEDDETIALGIQSYLYKHGFKVRHVRLASEAKLQLLNKNEWILVLLDLNLPDRNGYEICEFIRKKEMLPIIFLTVCDEEEEIVKGLDLGADDYITKPFKLSILLSRIQAVLRRTMPNESLTNTQKGLHRCGNICLDENKKYVYLENEKVELTAGEYKLLHILLTNKNQTLLRGQLLEKIWDENEQFVSDNTLTVTMKRLREKLKYPDCIKTIRGIGYLLEDVSCNEQITGE